MRFYNTLTRRLEEFKPLNPPKVGLYSCGPTVYDYAHIGNLRTYVFVDILKRSLEYLDFQVTHVMNITDVGHLTSDADTGEDKIEKGARREGKTVWQIAQFYTDYFFQVSQKLNLKKPDIVCKATDHIQEMIDLIKALEKKGYTYKISDGIYFDTSKFPNYGQLARLDLQNLKEGARVKKNPEKRNPTDFALWKFSPKDKKRQMEWESPWGKGFPGWHIECSAMSMKYLGETFDLHTGGIDHIPIHHTNEIAQSEAATGKPFVRYWLHANHLMVEGQKMSKSLGNFYRLEEIEKKGFLPASLRYLFLTAHYRNILDLRWQALASAQKAYLRLANFIHLAKEGERTQLSAEKLRKIEDFQKRFRQVLANDLDTPGILNLIWEMLKSSIPDYDKKELLLDWDEVLGLGFRQFLMSNFQVVTDKEIKLLMAQREKLRKEKKWAEADKIREEIEKRGYLVEDTPVGSRLKKRL